MKETGGPSSDPLPPDHLRQKVHAQQFTAHSKDRPTKGQDATSLRIAGMYVYCDLPAVAHSVTLINYTESAYKSVHISLFL